ncbi:MAG: Gfo/Idh/MocA family oxidoreductase, partial [Chloroflexi bacterium]|nr:Gfo/Idh/MocA family oxidoreductase [Chloroflexota bacterium]
MNLRVGIIGAGFIATRGHVPAYRAVPGVEVVALCDINEKRARAVSEELGIPQAYTDYHAMLEHENLDVVSVCSPNAFHAQMTIDALNAGAHVLCEKPMALNYADAQAMFAASQRAGRSLTIGFHMRYQPEFQTVKQILSDGKLGEVYYIKSSMLRRNGIPGYGSWFTNKDLAGGGAMMDIGCHMLDLSLWMLG